MPGFLMNRAPKIPGPGKTCDSKGCEAAPEWNVGLFIYPPKGPHRDCPLEADTSLYLCGPCGRDAKIEDVMTEEAWTVIDTTCRLARRLVPDRSRTKIRLLPILKL